MPFGIEGPFFAAMGWSIDRMMDMARLVAAWSTHLSASPLLTPLALLIGLVALGWFAFFRDRWRLLGPVAALPLVVLLGARPAARCADRRYDAGDGDTRADGARTR